MPSPEHDNRCSFGLFDFDKIVMKKHSGPITRAELIEHNAKATTAGQREQLWTVDTKHVYHGYALYCFLRPLILTIMHENESGGQVITNGHDETNHSQTEIPTGNCDLHTKEKTSMAENLARRQKMIQQKIESKQLYNHIFHHISIFHLPKSAIRSAKDYAIIADLCEDPMLIKRNADDMEKLRPELEVSDGMSMEEEEFERQLETITRIEFIEHNAKLCQNGEKHNLWSTGKNLVYHGQKLYKALLPLIKKYDRSGFNKHTTKSKHCHRVSYSTIFHFLNKFNIPWSDNERVKRLNTVGRLVDDPEEMNKINHEHTKLLIEDLRCQETPTVIINDFYECALRFSEAFNTSHDPFPWYGHFSHKIFPVGRDVDLDSFRQWPDYVSHGRVVRSPWIDEVGPYEPPEEPQSIFMVDEFDDISSAYWRDGVEPFYTEIDGEVAWELVLPQDVIKNDVATETQTITWRKRENQPERNDPEWMAKRRAQLHKVLGADYELHNKWAATMKKGWETFQELCTNWYPGYVEARPQYQPPPPEEPWQDFASQKSITKHREALLSYFVRHKFVKDVDLERYRLWPERTKEGWDKFLVVCNDWTVNDVPFRYKNTFKKQ